MRLVQINVIGLKAPQRLLDGTRDVWPGKTLLLGRHFPPDFGGNHDAVAMLLKLRGKDQWIVFPTTNSGYGIGEKGKFCTEETPLRPVSLVFSPILGLKLIESPPLPQRAILPGRCRLLGRCVLSFLHTIHNGKPGSSHVAL